MMPWVLVDVSCIAYRALHAVGELEFEDVPTGVIFGFFHQLRQVCTDSRIRSNKIAIFCDSRSSIRAKTYPEYKQKRRLKRTEEEIERIRSMRKQIDMLTSTVLPKMGFPVYSQDGLESDDLIAITAMRISNQAERSGGEGRQAVIITSDGDLFQCVNSWVHWFDPQRRVYHTPESFVEEKGIPARQWGEVKALSGCSSDNVAGVPGVGEPTAIRYLTGDLPPRFKAHETITSPKGQKIVKRNRKLVILPHSKTELIKPQEPSFDLSVFFQFCKKFGLLSILREKGTWSNFFRGTLFKTRKRGES